MRIIYHIQKSEYVNWKNNKTYDQHSWIHDFLLCLMAIANSRIVPGQCAEYWASSGRPDICKPIEYSMQINARIIG